MLNRLEAPSRLLIRTLLALFTCAVLLLTQSVFWNNAIGGAMRALVVGTAVLAFFRPRYALLALAALAPLGQVWGSLLGLRMREAEALVLAFLAGALMRGWTLGRFRSFPSDRIQTAAAVFGTVVAASCLEQIWFSQIQLDFPGPFLRDTMAHIARTYFTAFRGYGGIFNAMLLLEGLSLLLCVAHYSRTLPGFASKLVRMVVIGAVAASTLNLVFFSKELMATGEPLRWFASFFIGQRWSAHVGDVNAAGSFFAMGMFIALGVALRDRASRAYWIAAGSVCGLALWMTGSRTAVLIVFLIFVICAAKVGFGRSTSVLRSTALMAAALILLVVLLVQYFPASFTDSEAGTAVEIRWLFLGTTWRMLLWQPLFGVGVGQYALWSYHFAAPEMFNHYLRENAHNNFAQVAGELGVAGFCTFVAVLAVALGLPRRANLRPDPLRTPLLVGVSAFLLTWLGGHPLLVPEVSYPFWIALGVLAGLASPNRMDWRPAGAIVALVCVALLASIPYRVDSKSARLDYSRIRYGFSEPVAGGPHYVASRGRFFVPATGIRLALPIRARTARYDTPIEVEVFVDERRVDSVQFSNGDWQTARLTLQPEADLRFHQIDLSVKQPNASPGDEPRAGSRRSGIEIGEWRIISKPDG